MPTLQSGTFEVDDPDEVESCTPGSFFQALLSVNSLLLLPSVWAWSVAGGRKLGLHGNSFTGT